MVSASCGPGDVTDTLTATMELTKLAAVRKVF